MIYIIVIIPKYNFYKVIFEDEFIENDEYKTQNLIAEVIKLLGFNSKEYICHLCYKEKI